MKLLVLGSGSNRPIPRGDRCEQCQSSDPRDRRWPSALVVDDHFLIDCPPMIKELMDSDGLGLRRITHVINTHQHDDASGGLRFFDKAQKMPSPRYSVESFRVPHGRFGSQGFLINSMFVYCSDYQDIKPVLPYLERATYAMLDGSGWDKVFPSHQPMTEVIPLVKKFTNLERIYFTHNGHTHIPHAKLETRLRKLGDDRFFLTHHGMRIDL